MAEKTQKKKKNPSIFSVFTPLARNPPFVSVAFSRRIRPCLDVGTHCRDKCRRGRTTNAVFAGRENKNPKNRLTARAFRPAGDRPVSADPAAAERGRPAKPASRRNSGAAVVVVYRRRSIRVLLSVGRFFPRRRKNHEKTAMPG